MDENEQLNELLHCEPKRDQGRPEGVFIISEKKGAD